MTHSVHTIVDNNAYDMRNYEWLVELKNSKTYRGYFVYFAVGEGVVGDPIYPITKKKDYALCPRNRFREFEAIKFELREEPDYIIYFDYSEIKKMELVYSGSGENSST